MDCFIISNNIARVKGISKISIRLKHFFRYGNSKINNLIARDNRSDAIPLSLEVNSVTDTSHNLLYFPEQISNFNLMAPPPTLPVLTALKIINLTAFSIKPFLQIILPAKRYREANTFKKKPKIIPEDFTIGWICVLPIELATAVKTMDEEFADLPFHPTGFNIYYFGRIGNYNVVVIYLPTG